MRQPVPGGFPHRRSHFRVAFILILFVLLPCLAFISFNSPSLAADEETPKAIRRASQQSAPTIKDQRRVALVIGNSDYKDAPLRNPAHDAEDMAGVLRTLGFAVQTKINVNQREMEEAVNTLVQEIQNGDVALFYYSGHGAQVKGENYLIPRGESIKSESDARYKAVNAGLILAKMEESRNRTNIFILDAYRNNPFRGFRSLSKGLAMMDAPVGTFIAYATAPGSVAADGTDRNSPYTKHLLSAIKTKDATIEQVFKQVLREVRKETGGNQVPWTASSLPEDFYFNPSSLTSSSSKPSDERITEREREAARLRETERLAALERERLETQHRELEKVKELSVAYCDALIQGDREKVLSFYHFPMSEYFGVRNASRSFVEDDIDKYFALWDSRSGKLSSVSSGPGPPEPGNTCMRIVYDYSFITRSGTSKSGRSTTDLLWENINGTWKIKGTREKVDRYE